jgi:hypothetical protein
VETRSTKLAVVVWGLAAVLGACSGNSTINPALFNGDEPASCYHDWTQFFQTEAKDALLSGPSGQLSGPGATQDVPLYHDCQRFEQSPTQYGAFFAIFATRQVLNLPTLTDKRAVPVVQIVAWGNYQSLNITTGFNCVYMYMAGSSREARIVGSGSTEGDCRAERPVDATLLAEPLLEVKVNSTAGLALTDTVIPPVARWDRDPNNDQYYFGVKCGAAWCEVGAQGFASSTSILDRLNAAAASSGLTSGQRSRHAVKAWYDEQYLAVMSGGKAIPSKIKGTVIPDVGLITPISFDNNWVPVVRVLLDTTLQGNNPYKDKLNLAHTPPGQYNVVALCHSTTGCPGMDTPPTCTSPAYQTAASMSGQPQNWYAKITRVDSHVEYHCVIARSPPSSIASAIPRSARWHFLDDDDIIWQWCPSGCCEEWSEK